MLTLLGVCFLRSRCRLFNDRVAFYFAIIGIVTILMVPDNLFIWIKLIML